MAKMKILEKIELKKKIALELNKAPDFNDVANIFEELSIKVPERKPNARKESYVADSLKGMAESRLKKLANELDVGTENLTAIPPKIWRRTSAVKAFISHKSENTEYAMRLRDVLKKYNIDGFVAHKDIEPSKEWQEEIQKALDTMDFFITLHTEGFSEKAWCQQEVGFAVARGNLVIPIKFDENPMGFIAKYQALIRGDKKADMLVEDILDILESNEQTNDLYVKKISHLVIVDNDDDIDF